MSRPQTELEDFKSILGLKDSNGHQRILVGGHAVNAWATLYMDSEPELKSFLPLLSKDLDLIGTSQDLEDIARKTSLPLKRASNKIFIPSAGYIEFPHKSGEIVKVEILKRILGVRTADIQDGAVEIDHKGFPLRVIDPFTLLQAKTENTVQIEQNKPGFERQDEKHLKMMLLVTRAYLKDALKLVNNGEIIARDYLDLLEKLVKVASTETGKIASDKLGFKWLDCIPKNEMEKSPDPKIKNFMEKRLPRLLLDIEFGKRKGKKP